jgi:hypothetical protein
VGAVIDAVEGALTSDEALSVYAALMVLGVLIGVAVKMAPKLFRFVWKFVGEGGGGDQSYYDGGDFFRDADGDWHHMSDEYANWGSDGVDSSLPAEQLDRYRSDSDWYAAEDQGWLDRVKGRD